MQEIFSFVKENWQLIVAVITLIVSVIIALIRKRPVNDIVSWIYKFAVEAINDSEHQPVYAQTKEGKSEEKLKYAVAYVCEELFALFPSINTSFYEKLIADVIEKILTTPQKKGE